jgi:hypothetical protein
VLLYPPRDQRAQARGWETLCGVRYLWEGKDNSELARAEIAASFHSGQ